MKNKRSFLYIGIGCVAVLVCFLWCGRVKMVNFKAAYPEVIYHKTGEAVKLEDNMFIADFISMDGYSVAVSNAKIYSLSEYLSIFSLSTEDYIEQNNYSLISDYAYRFLVPEKIVVVDVELSNSDNMETGVNFEWWSLSGAAAYIQLDTYLYGLANPQMQGSTMTSAKPNSTAVISLPFGVRERDIDNNGWCNIEKEPLFLVISDFPTSHRLAIFK